MAKEPRTLVPESDDARIARDPADDPSDGAGPGAESDWALRVLHKRLVQLQWDALRELEDRQGLAFTGAVHNAPPARERKPLIRWPSLSLEHYQAYRREPNAVRLDHVFRLLRPGDRILDIGCGFGYVPGVLVRDGALSYYCGIDSGSHRIAAAREMAEVNGLDHRSFRFETRDLFAITPEFMAAQRPDLILLLEILEHLNDPVAALCAVIGPAPRTACVLISVPRAGRLEECKGHVSFFNVDRLQWLCRQTGLNVHFVESVYDTWAFVLASRATKIPERVVSMYEAMIDRATPAVGAPSGMFATRTSRTCDRAARRFEPVSFADSAARHISRWNYRTRSVSVKHAGLRCDVQGGDDDGCGQYGGIRFHAPSPKALRLVLSLDNPQNIQRVFIDGYDAAKRRVIRWTWRPSGVLDRRIGPIECLLEPGRAAEPFVLTDGAELDRVHEVHVFVRIHHGTRAGLLLLEAETAR